MNSVFPRIVPTGDQSWKRRRLPQPLPNTLGKRPVLVRCVCPLINVRELLQLRKRLRRIEAAEVVDFYARNDHLGLTIPYEYIEVTHSYEPDFLVRLKNGVTVILEIKGYEFDSVFVDPPRAGMDPDTCELTRRFDRILYISCNPETLAANIQQLHDTHKVVRCALFDQFPYTHHMESGVLLERR